MQCRSGLPWPRGKRAMISLGFVISCPQKYSCVRTLHNRSACESSDWSDITPTCIPRSFYDPLRLHYSFQPLKSSPYHSYWYTPNSMKGLHELIWHPRTPSHMKVIRYNRIRDFELVSIPVSEPKAHEILIQGSWHLRSPLLPGVCLLSKNAYGLTLLAK